MARARRYLGGSTWLFAGRAWLQALGEPLPRGSGELQCPAVPVGRVPNHHGSRVRLALQVMMTDDVALADDALQERLIVLQDRIENVMRDRLGLPDRDAAGEQA